MEFGNGMIDGYGEEEEPIAFHHKNGEYRKYMDPKLADIATGKNQPKRGFFRVLVSTRGNRCMFFVLCLTFVIYFGVNIFAKNSNEDTVNGIDCNISSFSFADSLYVTLEMKDTASSKKKDSKNLSEPRKVSFEIELYNSDGALSYTDKGETVFDGNEYFYRNTYTYYDYVKVDCKLSSGEEQKTITAKVQQR